MKIWGFSVVAQGKEKILGVTQGVINFLILLISIHLGPYREYLDSGSAVPQAPTLGKYRLTTTADLWLLARLGRNANGYLPPTR